MVTTANFILPEFFADNKMNIILLDLCKKHPEIMKENIDIYGFYGIFPGCIWNGGRVILGNQCSKEHVKEIFNIYNNYYNLPLRLTFTNALIQEEHCYDTYCNMIAECGHNGMNEILVTSPILEKYLKNKYPNYKYCKSVTSTEHNNYNVTDYYMSVLPKTMNNDFQVLSSFPVEDRKKLEIICNDDCIDNCPYTYEHYRIISKAQLEYTTSLNVQCKMKLNTDFPHKELNNLKQKITYENIIENYLPLDYQYFKLCGRENATKRKLNWIHYIIKPEYHDDILYKII